MSNSQKRPCCSNPGVSYMCLGLRNQPCFIILKMVCYAEIPKILISMLRGFDLAHKGYTATNSCPFPLNSCKTALHVLRHFVVWLSWWWYTFCQYFRDFSKIYYWVEYLFGFAASRTEPFFRLYRAGSAKRFLYKH